MKILKNNLKIIIAIICTMILTSSVYAAYDYYAKDVSYTKPDGSEVSVEKALNDLYLNQITNIKNTTIYKNVYTTGTSNPYCTKEYTFEKDGLVIVNLGGRTAARSCRNIFIYNKNQWS